MSDIFISYGHEDEAIAKCLVEALERVGFSVWWDCHILPGTRFRKDIEEELNAANCVVVLWSNNSVESKWVQIEAAEGYKREILISVLIEDVRIPFAFGQLQAACLIDWDGKSPHAGVEKLIEAIKRKFPWRKRWVYQNRSLLILAVAMLLVLVVIFPEVSKIVVMATESKTSLMGAILVILSVIGAIGYMLISSAPEGGWTVGRLTEAIKEKFQQRRRWFYQNRSLLILAVAMVSVFVVVFPKVSKIAVMATESKTLLMAAILVVLVSCQPCNVAKNITPVLHNQSEMIEYEEIHRDTCQRGARSS